VQPEVEAGRPNRISRRPAPSSAVIDNPARSLRIACLVWTGLWSVGLLMNNVIGPAISPDRPLDDAWPFPANPVALGTIVLSLALGAYAGRPGVPPQRLMNLALLYEMAVAFGIGVVNQWTPNVHGLSWICVVVLVHPLLVPTPPGRTLIASMAAASMDLVGLRLTAARGVEIPPASVLLWTYLPNYLCALLAVIPARVRSRMEEHRKSARELGSYLLGELLSRGGMGEVYRAEHRLLARPAAVKLVRPELLGGADPEARNRTVRRFEREARATARLRSPHTVNVYDFGVSDGGDLYYVMELLEGIDLHDLVRDFGPAPPERTVAILLQVCDSLAEAHAVQLIHRDIKPSNVYLCRYGLHCDFVKVVDFGLAKTLDGTDGDSRVTRDAAVPGTPAFMAPEQILGTAPVGAATDIYAVGCLAHWLLTGRLVFEGKSPIDVLAQHARSEPQAPSRFSELPVPAGLDRIVLQCLEKDPKRRPAGAEALARELGAVPLAEPWTAERARQWWEIHRPAG
jgi:serine/threonine-protein kinase